MSLLRVLGQAATWSALAALVGALATGPGFAPLGEGEALLKFSLAHLSERLAPCRRLSEAERQALPPTRRAYEVCERGRAPTVIELRLNDELLVSRRVDPAGLRNDGRSYYLDSFPVPAGEQLLELKLRDTPRESGFDLERRMTLRLAPGEAALIEVGDDGVAFKAPAKRTKDSR
jgi:hypothetical protein